MQGGYNWQVESFVIGLETDFNYNGINVTTIADRPLAAPVAGNLDYNVSQKFDWFGTLRGRAGVTPLPEWLLYITGGLAYGHVNSSTRALFSVGDDLYMGSKSTTRVGWTIGTGSEVAVRGPGDLQLQRRMRELRGPGVRRPRVQDRDSTREHIVRFGLDYRFGGGRRP